MLPLAVFTADNEQIFTVTLDLSVQNASLSLANVAWYVLNACSAESIAMSGMQPAEIVREALYTVLA